jgi:hypothetical protein
MMLVPLVDLREFVNLALVIYPELLRHRMAPELTPASLHRMLRTAPFGSAKADSGADQQADPAAHLQPAVSRLPPEIWLQIAESLEPANSLAVIFAIGPLFWQIPCGQILELRSVLRVWSRRSREGK